MHFFCPGMLLYLPIGHSMHSLMPDSAFTHTHPSWLAHLAALQCRDIGEGNLRTRGARYISASEVYGTSQIALRARRPPPLKDRPAGKALHMLCLSH